MCGVSSEYVGDGESCQDTAHGNFSYRSWHCTKCHLIPSDSPDPVILPAHALMLGQIICQSVVDILNGLGAEQVHGMKKLSIGSQVSVLITNQKLDHEIALNEGCPLYPIPKTWDSMTLLKLNGGRLRSRHQDIHDHTVFYCKA